MGELSIEDEYRVPLMYACEKDETEIIKLILEVTNASVNIVDKENQTILLQAARNKNLLLLKLLIEKYNFDYKTLINISDDYGWNIF